MHSWQLPDRLIEIDSTALVMGIVNVTPDSFSDGGRFAAPEKAVAHALQLIEDGADILDVGGESTRPGSTPIPLEEELSRVLPVVQALARQTSIPLSIDTSKAAVARACLENGALIINDVTALGGDPEMPAVVSKFRAGVILMHMQGTPATMQVDPRYDDVIADLLHFFQKRMQTLTGAGISPERIVLDPGIGFGKNREHNLEILAGLKVFQDLGRPICLGVSRKGFLGKILDRPVDQRLAASLAVACHALGRDAVQILRVHDVRETKDAVRVFHALQSRTHLLPVS